MGVNEIEIVGAQEHNLKDLSLNIPKRKLVAFTGVSGSGKSSLIFDTVFAESFRRFADASQVPVHLMGRSSFAQSKRPKFSAIRGLPPALGLSQRQGVAGKLSTVGTISGVSDLLRVYFAAFGSVFCKNCDLPLHSMSFQDVLAAVEQKFVNEKIVVFAPIAEKRKGAFADEMERFRRFGFTKMRLNGKVVRLDGPEEDLRLDPRKLNTVELVVDSFALRSERLERAERALVQALDIGKLVRIENSEGTHTEIFNLSSACPQCGESAPQLDPRHFSHSSLGKCLVCEGTGELQEGLPADLFPCKDCGGGRLTKNMPIVRVRAKTFAEMTKLSLQEMLSLAKEIWHDVEATSGKKNNKAKSKVLDEAVRLLSLHSQLGIGHLTLSRAGHSLSPGDLQRLRLSSLLSNRLRGALYVLDEPCQGLTQGEVQELVKLLRVFVNEGSSVVVVEHHPEFLLQSDQVFVMGPGAGENGGELVGQMAGALYDPSLESKMTLASASAKHQSLIRDVHPRFAEPTRSSSDRRPLVFKEIGLRNLSGREVEIFPGVINLLRGPSGSGKSTFVQLCLAPVLGRFVSTEEPLVDFKNAPGFSKDPFKVTMPKGFAVTGLNFVKPGSLMRSSRRTVASALDLLPLLRQRFEALVGSQVLGLVAADFSWSSKKGQCPECQGRGYKEFEQKYSPSLEVLCSSCNGTRLGRRSMVPKLRGKNIADVLEMSLERAVSFFEHDKQVRVRLEAAIEFGLGYIKLNQTLDALSGGEMQRLMLTLELKRARMDGIWYLLAHPGTGLHLPDIEVLGLLLRRLIDRGATFVIVENREEFAEFADHTIQF